MPPTIPINHYLRSSETKQIEPRSCLIIPCECIQGFVQLETLNPKPLTLNPKPLTLNPKPLTLNPKP